MVNKKLIRTSLNEDEANKVLSTPSSNYAQED